MLDAQAVAKAILHVGPGQTFPDISAALAAVLRAQESLPLCATPPFAGAIDAQRMSPGFFHPSVDGAGTCADRGAMITSVTARPW